jgi:predicted secreted hydrolase
MQMDLLVTPNLADQELITRRTTQVTYWEGSVSIQGRSGQKPVSGVGYVELTGYEKPVQLLPP